MASEPELVAWADMEFLRENGDVGDCVRASTASILGVDRQIVPHFVRDNAGDWKWPWRDFVKERGYEVVEVDPRLRPECLYLACGPTERSVGDGTASHMVVMNGRALAHDPHPSRKGLTGIDRVYLLVPLSPAAALAAAEQRGRESERERCAKIADDGAEQADRAFRGFTALNAAAFMHGRAQAVAAAIRKGE